MSLVLTVLMYFCRYLMFLIPVLPRHNKKSNEMGLIDVFGPHGGPWGLGEEIQISLPNVQCLLFGSGTLVHPNIVTIIHIPPSN